MIPLNLKKLMTLVEKNGYEIYIVGGAVRDRLMNRPISDWDLTTNARPEVIQDIFDKTVDIGIKFGTVQVQYENEFYEITTYRKDSLKSNGRKPDFVEFTMDLKDDLSRRDFTINAMVMNKEAEIFDYFHGKLSIKNKILTTVGNPYERFKEDYLRVFRYIRLTQQLNFSANPALDETILDLPINSAVSFERIRLEFNKILLSDEPSKGLRHLKRLNLLSYIIPGIEATYDFNQHSIYHHLNVFDHTLAVVDHTPENIVIRIAALFHDIAKPSTFELVNGEGHFYGHDRLSETMAKSSLQRLKYSNEIINQVCLLIKNHMRLLDVKNTGSIKKFIRKINEKNIFLWLALRKADILSCKTQETLEDIDILQAEITRILTEVPPLSLSDLKLTGYDLLKEGYEGKIIGIIKNDLLEIVDTNPEFNEKIIMLDYVKNNFKENK